MPYLRLRVSHLLRFRARRRERHIVVVLNSFQDLRGSTPVRHPPPPTAAPYCGRLLSCEQLITLGFPLPTAAMLRVALQGGTSFSLPLRGVPRHMAGGGVLHGNGLTLEDESRFSAQTTREAHEKKGTF